MHKLLRLYFLGIVIILLFSSCQRRYWFRIKLPGEYKRKYTTRIDVINLSPSMLSQRFEEIITTASKRELKKSGFIVSPKDTPVYIFKLFMFVDSFNTNLKGMGLSPKDRIDTSYYGLNSYPIKKQVKAVYFNCQLFPNKSNIPLWQVWEDIYFFNDEERDLGRSVGTVRYLIRYGNRNWENR